MSASAKPNAFRFAVWPGGELPVPRNLGWRVSLLPGGWLYGEEAWSDVEAPDELYSRELRTLNLGADDEVVAFLNEYGYVSIPDWRLLVSLSGSWLWMESLDHPALPRLQELRSAKRTHIDEVREVLALARDAERYYRALTGRLEGAEAVALHESSLIIPPPRDVPASAPIEQWIAIAFEDIVNWGLRDFSVNVRVLFGDEKPMRGESWRHVPDLFAVLCLQMANHAATNATWRQCRNETCGIWYVHQRGRSNPRTGKRWSKGTLYCSDSCARTQGSREWRRRKRAEKGGVG